MQISKSRMVSLLSETQLSPPNATTGSPSGFIIEPAEREALLRWIQGTTTAQRVVIRSGVLLLASAGWSDTRIAEQLGISRRTVAVWKTRYRTDGAKTVLVDAPGRGRKPGRDVETVSKILLTTREMAPPASRWTVRTLARVVGVSHATVQRVWREHGITPTAARV